MRLEKSDVKTDNSQSFHATNPNLANERRQERSEIQEILGAGVPSKAHDERARPENKARIANSNDKNQAITANRKYSI